VGYGGKLGNSFVVILIGIVSESGEKGLRGIKKRQDIHGGLRSGKRCG
jgi:hypothetical protein